MKTEMEETPRHQYQLIKSCPEDGRLLNLTFKTEKELQTHL